MFARLLVCVVYAAAASIKSETLRNEDLSTFRIVGTITANGFPVETHHVTTIDGYILEMHRIPHGRAADNSINRPIVFLMHGLTSASHAFIGLGADYSLAYNLADEGFDVWMGNARGNYYSRHHIYLDPDDDTEKYTFFDFTFEEIALHDLPAMIDYALELTGNQQVYYIGHSQGGTVFLVLTTLRPEYNVKIASAHLLAGVGYQEYFPNRALAAFAANVDEIYRQALAMGIVELYPEYLNPPQSQIMSDYCTSSSNQSYMCQLFEIGYILRNYEFSETEERDPPGASLKQAAHYGQNIRDKLFRRYHYGAETNLLHYGLDEPPLYDLNFISCDVTMHYSMNDDLLDERDVLAMVADMPNAKARRVARDSFSHADYVAALDAKELVTNFIIDALKNTPIAEPESSTDIDPVSVTDNIQPEVTDDTTAPTITPETDDSSNTLDPTISTTETAEADTTTPADETTPADAPTPADTEPTTPEPDSASNVMINMCLLLLSSFILILQ